MRNRATTGVSLIEKAYSVLSGSVPSCYTVSSQYGIHAIETSHQGRHMNYNIIKFYTRGRNASMKSFATTGGDHVAVPRLAHDRRGASSGGRGPSLFKKLLLLAPPALAGYLGFWQLGRREEKMEMLEERNRMMSHQEDPQNVFQLMAVNAQSPGCGIPEYMQVSASGIYDEEKSQFIGPRPRSTMGVTEAGYFMVTPLVHSSGESAVLVLRGWVPASWKSGDVDNKSRSKNHTEFNVRGVVRFSERPSMFVPKNNAERGDWFFIDVPALCKATGLPQSTPLIEIVTQDEEIVQSGGKANPTAMDILGGRTTIQSVNDVRGGEEYPLPKSLGDLRHFSVMPRDHMNYALTWFSLSAATTGLALQILRKRM